MFWHPDGGAGLSPEDLITCVARLTGTEVKGQDGIDKDGLEEILQDDSRPIDCSQFNELLLMVHKDRVEAPFFDHFFGPDCTIGTIPRGVERFQQAALLLYGNFVFGYRKLSRMKDVAEFKREVAAAFPDAKAEAAYFQNRQPKLLEIDRIEKDQTPFVGYLSANEVRADFRRCELLLAAAETVGAAGAWDELLTTVREMAQQEELALLERSQPGQIRVGIGRTEVVDGRFQERQLFLLSHLADRRQKLIPGAGRADRLRRCKQQFASPKVGTHLVGRKVANERSLIFLDAVNLQKLGLPVLEVGGLRLGIGERGRYLALEFGNVLHAGQLSVTEDEIAVQQ